MELSKIKAVGINFTKHIISVTLTIICTFKITKM